MTKKIWYIVLAVVVVGFGAYTLLKITSKSSDQPDNSPVVASFSPMNATYVIEGQSVTLVSGKAETQAAPSSATKVTTTLFGQPVSGDLNGDGVPDAGVILVQNSGGSGTFYYVAADIATNTGDHGTNAVLLGDRIAPQTTEIRNGQLIANYADRKPGEPMTATPSVGVSKYLIYSDSMLKEAKVPPVALQKGTVTGVVLLSPTCPVEHNPPDPNCAPRPYQTTIRVQSTNPAVPTVNIPTSASGTFSISLNAGNYIFTPKGGSSMLPSCHDTQVKVSAGQAQNVNLDCDTGIR